MSACINWLFTLNNYTETEILYLQHIFDNDDHKFRYLLFQKEIAPTTGTPHLQGYLQCKKRQRFDQVISMLGTTRVSIAKQAPKATSDNNYNYCTDSTKRAPGDDSGPWEYGTRTGAGKRNDIDNARDAIQADPYITDLQLITDFPRVVAMYPRYLNTARNIFQEEEVPDDALIPRAGWQTELSGELQEEASARKVIWYCDVVGGSGKSTFARCFKKGDRKGFTVTGGRHQDIYYAYKREPVVFVDLARVAVDKVPYEVIENFKNGGFLSTKYESVWKKFKIPHVVVFANFMPDESKLSADRWDIREI